MAWCPFAIHKPLSENHLQGAITPRAVILHTAVSSSNSLFDFFQNNSDLESHFYVTEEGVIEQYMDTQIRADANKNANSFAVSIETEDGREIRPWSPPQLAALIRLVTWLCDTHKIPKRQIPTADGSGIGWHVMFGAPGPWTPVSKSCPGAPRITQTRNTLIPAVANGVKPIPTVEELMRLAEPRDLPVTATPQRKVFPVEVGKIGEGGNSSVVAAMWLVITSADFGDPTGSTEYSVWAGNDSGAYVGFGNGSSAASGKLTKNGWAVFVLKPGTRTVTLEWTNHGKAQAGYSFPQVSQ